jgi:hypothetical protein
MANTYEVRPHPRNPETHRLAVVTTGKGYVYAASWAEPWPTVEEVREEWRDNRRTFEPYDEVNGVFLSRGR